MPKNEELLSIGKLAELSGLRLSTIKYYTEQGLIPFEQSDKRLNRKYPKDAALKRISEINTLKEKKRYTIEEMKEYFNK